MLTYGSVCSGIEAASVAWGPLGWNAAFVSEIEAFPRAVLSHHYPATPLHGDFTTIQASDYAPIDLLVGGTPCQSFSVAGLRGGMADERGNLALEYLRLADRLRPRWLVWENVPGVLSSNGGRDFGSFLGGLGQLGYGFAYRVLDACYFGVPQQRSRVFVVAHADWRRAAAVLFEPDSFSRSVAPRLPAALSVCITRRGPGSLDDRETYIVEGQNPRHMTPLEIERAFGFPDNYTAIPASVLREVRRGQTAGRLPPPAARPDGQALMVQSMRERGAEGVTQEERPSACQKSLEPCNTIRADGGLRKRNEGSAGRALRHLSCSSTSLGGGPRPQDGCGARDALPSLQHQAPSHRGYRVSQSSVGVSKPVVADGPRYRALGNSMAVPVMAWIGRRIAAQHCDASKVRPATLGRAAGASPADWRSSLTCGSEALQRSAAGFFVVGTTDCTASVSMTSGLDTPNHDGDGSCHPQVNPRVLSHFGTRL